VDVVRAATRVLVQSAVTGAAVIKAVREVSRGNSSGRPARTSSRTRAVGREAIEPIRDCAGNESRL